MTSIDAVPLPKDSGTCLTVGLKSDRESGIERIKRLVYTPQVIFTVALP